MSFGPKALLQHLLRLYLGDASYNGVLTADGITSLHVEPIVGCPLLYLGALSSALRDRPPCVGSGISCSSTSVTPTSGVAVLPIWYHRRSPGSIALGA